VLLLCACPYSYPTNRITSLQSLSSHTQTFVRSLSVMARRHNPPEVFHCAICDAAFDTKDGLNRHYGTKACYASPPEFLCSVCKWDFDSSHALELHRIHTDHGTLNLSRDNSSQRFISQKGLDNHGKPALGHIQAPAEPEEMKVFCNRCDKSFSSQKRFSEHRSDLASKCADWRHTPPKKQLQSPSEGYIDPDKPKDENSRPILTYDVPTQESDASTNTSNGELRCSDCKRKFKSLGHYNNHFLGCIPIEPHSQPDPVVKVSRKKLQVTPPAPEMRLLSVSNNARVTQQPKSKIPTHTAGQTVISKPYKPTLSQQHQVSTASPTPAADTGTHVCNTNGCGKTFRSEAGLKQHRIDIHGVGGQKLDIGGRDSWMLNARERERLKQQGLLRVPSGPVRGNGSSNASTRTIAPLAHRPPNVPLRTHLVTDVMPTSTSMGGVPDMEQAKQIQTQALRLLIQSDIFIHYDGGMTVGCIRWTRISAAKQAEVAGMLDNMCHLPKMLQGEYLPAPKAFLDEYKACYDLADFQPCPSRDLGKPARDVVVLSCSKVVLEGGRQEVVKIAAIDLVTCGILMNHLVCTDSNAHVTDWRSTVTGLSSWRDVEAARHAGYKIFKGWSAARAALQKYVDNETIIVGHNLRSDLDALCIVHGRAVDIAKVAEKAANGPLSKAQLNLDSLCRDYPERNLTSDPMYGRDCLVNAFAVREFALWAIKNREKLERNAKQKSLDYQRIRPAASAVASP
jgi:hypothetical protein